MQRSLVSPHADRSPRPLYQSRFPCPAVDLDEQSRLSLTSSYEDDFSVSDDEPASLSRVSLGPKMRFHSRAPWELDENTARDDEPSSPAFSTSKKSFPFSFARSSDSGRPSVDSTSPPKSKHSFETTSSQQSHPRGALYTLAQESLSATSLGSSNGQHASHRKFSLNAFRSESNHDHVQNHTSSGPRSPTFIRFADPSPRREHDTSHSLASRRRPTYRADDFHPYANPDLVGSYAPDQLHEFDPKPSSRASESPQLAPAVPSTFTSPSLVPLKNGTQGEAVSPPIISSNNVSRLEPPSPENDQSSISSSRPTPDGSSGWAGRNILAPFTLISLEEARAQRSRSATIHAAECRRPSAPLLSPDAKFGSECRVQDSSGYNTLLSLGNRSRSISAGTDVQSSGNPASGLPKLDIPTLGEIPATSLGPAGKPLKHKRSHFLRLFNGRTLEKEDKTQPLPPSPTLGEYIDPHKVTITTLRMPLREPSPPLLAAPFYEKPSPCPSFDGAQQILPSCSRPTSSLSIDTHHIPTSTASDIAHHQTCNQSLYLLDEQHDIPQSAPPNLTDFPTLRLRPVSTVFSAEFTEHLIKRESLSSIDTTNTPALGSTSRILSPATPSSATRSEMLKSDVCPSPMSYNDNSSAVRALQEQVLAERAEKLTYQRQRLELQSRLTTLEIELQELRAAQMDDYCSMCGRGQKPSDIHGSRLPPRPLDLTEGRTCSILNRPRARTATSTRFGSTIP